MERNGQHYFAGLSMWPRPLQERMLQRHGDLYHAGPGGQASVRIDQGRLAVDSLLAAPFGVALEPHELTELVAP
jgi:hypothetical protein